MKYLANLVSVPVVRHVVELFPKGAVGPGKVCVLHFYILVRVEGGIP